MSNGGAPSEGRKAAFLAVASCRKRGPICSDVWTPEARDNVSERPGGDGVSGSFVAHVTSERGTSVGGAITPTGFRCDLVAVGKSVRETEKRGCGCASNARAVGLSRGAVLLSKSMKPSLSNAALKTCGEEYEFSEAGQYFQTNLHRKGTRNSLDYSNGCHKAIRSLLADEYPFSNRCSSWNVRRSCIRYNNQSCCKLSVSPSLKRQLLEPSLHLSVYPRRLKRSRSTRPVTRLVCLGSMWIDGDLPGSFVPPKRVEVRLHHLLRLAYRR